MLPTLDPDKMTKAAKRDKVPLCTVNAAYHRLCLDLYVPSSYAVSIFTSTIAYIAHNNEYNISCMYVMPNAYVRALVMLVDFDINYH